MKNTKWYWTQHKNDETKEWFICKSKHRSVRLVITQHFEPAQISKVKFDFGITVRKVKRNFFQRICFWFLRLKFKDMTKRELKKLSSKEQKKHLDEKYYLYGIVPYLKDKVSDVS